MREKKGRTKNQTSYLTFQDGQSDHDITITIHMPVVSRRRHLIPQDPSRLQLRSWRLGSPGSPGCGMRLKPRPSPGLQLMGDADEIHQLPCDHQTWQWKMAMDQNPGTLTRK